MLSSIAKTVRGADRSPRAIIAAVVLALGASPLGVFAALCEGAFGNWYAMRRYAGEIHAADFHRTRGLDRVLGRAVEYRRRRAADRSGAIAAGAIGPYLGGWPHPVAIVFVLIAGALGGAVWGGICGWLRARRDINEVISTIMLNFVAAQLLSWMVHGPLMEAVARVSDRAWPIAPSARMYISASRRAASTSAMLLAVVLAVGCYLLSVPHQRRIRAARDGPQPARREFLRHSDRARSRSG